MWHTKEQVVSLGGPGGLNEDRGGVVKRERGWESFFLRKSPYIAYFPDMPLYPFDTRCRGNEADPEREREREDESRQRLARTRVPAWERKYTRRDIEREGE